MEEQIGALQKLINTAIEFLVNYSFQVVGAIIVLVVGVLIARWVGSLLLASFQKKQVDVTLSKFTVSCISAVIIGFAVIIALGKFGITIAPFIAALGALAFGASMAIQGPLSNYGAGISIILSRPFVVGNTVSVAGVNGVVEEVKLACTVLTDEDGTKITIPNKEIVGQILHNSFENRIVEAKIGVSYSSDTDKAAEVIRKVLSEVEGVAQSPRPQIGIQEFADSSINIGYRYWAPTKKYYQILFEVNRRIFKRFAEANIAIPFPQREVRVLSNVETVLK